MKTKIINSLLLLPVAMLIIPSVNASFELSHNAQLLALVISVAVLISIFCVGDRLVDLDYACLHQRVTLICRSLWGAACGFYLPVMLNFLFNFSSPQEKLLQIMSLSSMLGCAVLPWFLFRAKPICFESNEILWTKRFKSLFFYAFVSSLMLTFTTFGVHVLSTNPALSLMMLWLAAVLGFYYGFLLTNFGLRPQVWLNVASIAFNWATLLFFCSILLARSGLIGQSFSMMGVLNVLTSLFTVMFSMLFYGMPVVIFLSVVFYYVDRPD